MTDNNPNVPQHQLTEAQKVQQAENEANAAANAVPDNTVPQTSTPVQNVTPSSAPVDDKKNQGSKSDNV